MLRCYNYFVLVLGAVFVFFKFFYSRARCYKSDVSAGKIELNRNFFFFFWSAVLPVLFLQACFKYHESFGNRYVRRYLNNNRKYFFFYITTYALRGGGK